VFSIGQESFFRISLSFNRSSIPPGGLPENKIDVDFEAEPLRRYDEAGPPLAAFFPRSRELPIFFEMFLRLPPPAEQKFVKASTGARKTLRMHSQDLLRLVPPVIK